MVYIRLTKEPNGTVNITVDSIMVQSDRNSTFNKGRDINKRFQVHVNGGVSDTITFDSSTWKDWAVLEVRAVDDNITEGVDYLNFAPQPSLLGKIQGPIRISGANSPEVPQLVDPLRLPTETNPDFFEPPGGYLIDMSSEFVYEEDQVDTLILNDLDTRGESSLGILRCGKIDGMSMGLGIYIAGEGPFSGIDYDGIEIIVLNLGDGVDEILIEDTTEAVHVLNLGKGDDIVTVKTLIGPLLVNGNEGNDAVHLTPVTSTLDNIQALVTFDGGISSGSVGDVLTLNDSADNGLDDVLNVTRFIVEVESMGSNATSLSAPTCNSAIDSTTSLPQESYLINLQNATEGTFTLKTHDPVNNRNGSTTIKYNASAQTIEDELELLLLPTDEQKTCGKKKDSKCSKHVKVWELGDSNSFAIFFMGERLNAKVTLDLETSNLVDFDSEKFLNKTNDILYRNSDVAYTNLDFLEIFMGHQDNVLNVRGTSAKTSIVTQEGDDTIFVS